MGFSSDHINHYVLTKQCLTPRSRSDNPIEIVSKVIGLHATEFKTPFLSCFARSKNFRKEDLYRELYKNRSLSKIKAMRNTLFIFHKDFVPTVFTALQGEVLKASAIYLEKYMNMFGVDKELYDRTSKEILNIVGKESMDAATIKKRLKERVPDERLWKRDRIVNGKRRYTGPDAAGYIIYSLCDQCKLARVGFDGMTRQHYLRWDKWFPELKMGKDVIGTRKRLIESYISSFGPVTLKDIAWWTGFSNTAVSEVLEGMDITYVEWEGMESFEYFMTTGDLKKIKKHKPGKGGISLLPVLDVYTMGYKDRSRFVDPDNQKSLYDRSGNAYPAILQGGRVIGVWRYPDFSRSPISPKGVKKFRFFEEKDSGVRKEVEKEYRRVVDFLKK
jgi:hypothetical protein